MTTVVPVEWESLGGKVPGEEEITVVSWEPGRLDLFYVGNDNAAYHKYFDSGAWGPSITNWESLGGSLRNIYSAIAAVSWGPGRLDLFYVGNDNAVYHKYFDSGAWGPSMTDWESLGGEANSSITAVSWGPGRLDLFYVGIDNAVYHKYFDSGAWVPSVTDWESLGGTSSYFITAVSWGPGRLDLFLSLGPFPVLHKYFDSGAWGPSMTDWESLGSFAEGPLIAISWGPGRLDLFQSSPNLVAPIYHKYFDSGGWGPSMTDWESLTNQAQGFIPTVVSWGPGRLDLFYVDFDDFNGFQMYQMYFDGAWRTRQSLGIPPEFYGTAKYSIQVVSWGAGRLDLFSILPEAPVYHKYFDSGAWGPSMTDWESLGATSPPAFEDLLCFSSGPGRLDLFLPFIQNKSLYHIYYDDGSWKPLPKVLYTCIVNCVGPATDGTETNDPVVYINLTDTGNNPAAFVRQWFYAAEGGQDQMLDVALAAMNGGKHVQAAAEPPNSGGSPYTRIARLNLNPS
jgi:hypothetical protein